MAFVREHNTRTSRKSKLVVMLSNNSKKKKTKQNPLRDCVRAHRESSAQCRRRSLFYMMTFTSETSVYYYNVYGPFICPEKKKKKHKLLASARRDCIINAILIACIGAIVTLVNGR